MEVLCNDADSGSFVWLVKAPETLCVTRLANRQRPPDLRLDQECNLEPTSRIFPGGLQGIMKLAADLAATGEVEAALGAIAWCLASADGEGDAIADVKGKARLDCDIKSYGEFTAEGVRDAIWNALAAQFDKPGTMGEKLNDAGSAANPWTEVIEGTMTAEEALRIMLAALAGKATGGGTAEIRFRDLADTKDRILATVDESGNRSEVVLDGK